MAERRKIELTLLENLIYYKIPLIFVMLFLVVSLTYLLNYQNSKFIFFFICSILSASIASYHYFKQKKRLYYYSFKSSTSSYSFKKLIESVVIELDCTKKVFLEIKLYCLDVKMYLMEVKIFL